MNIHLWRVDTQITPGQVSQIVSWPFSSPRRQQCSSDNDGDADEYLFDFNPA